MYTFTGYGVLIVLLSTILSYFFVRSTVKCVRENNTKDAKLLGVCSSILIIIDIVFIYLSFTFKV